MCNKTADEQKSGFEQSIIAELIYKSSDISQLAKWPLRLMAAVCALGSALIWDMKKTGYWYLNSADIAFTDSFLSFTKTTSTVLKAGLLISSIVIVISLALFIFSFFKRNTSKMLKEAIELLLSNSFYFGISLFFILLAIANLSHAASQIMVVATQKTNCANNLNKLGKALLSYARQNHHHYPEPYKWCDVLIKNNSVTEADFLCPGAAEGNCHYAMNPNAEPVSKYDDFDSFLDSYGIDQKQLWSYAWSHRNEKTYEKRDALRLQYDSAYSSSKKMKDWSNIVLLFETKEGWNQLGGPELLTTENHEGKGANILFNDGRVKFVEPDKLDTLKW